VILKNILKTKTVSVWGLGYLGYTTILRLQNSGFNVVAYDLNQEHLDLFASSKYPTKEQIAVWSQMGYLPKLDYDKVKIAKDPRELFESSYLHIIAIPEVHKNILQANVASQIADLFADNLKNSDKAPFIIFESAFIPGHIEKHFVENLKKQNIICSKDYYLGVMFRTDWSIESFIKQKYKTPVAAYCKKSLRAMREMLDYIGIVTLELGNLKEAEIYVNSINAIQAMASDFMRQLALGYPSVDMKKVSELLFRGISLESCTLNMGTGGERMTFAIDNLIFGSNNPGKLTLLKEFQDINISSVLNYGEYILRHGHKSVAILGVTYKGNQKDLTLSPAITLADYLIKNSVKVLLNDPFCAKEEINKFVKGASVVEFPEGVFSADVLIVACDHNQYKGISQAALENIKKETKLIIDNCGIWSHLSFGNNIKYCQVGDGTLDILK
jgi:nucleotide sugar dehydrogenase